jgi:hypothetical protein
MTRRVLQRIPGVYRTMTNPPITTSFTLDKSFYESLIQFVGGKSHLRNFTERGDMEIPGWLPNFVGPSTYLEEFADIFYSPLDLSATMGQDLVGKFFAREKDILDYLDDYHMPEYQGQSISNYIIQLYTTAVDSWLINFDTYIRTRARNFDQAVNGATNND